MGFTLNTIRKAQVHSSKLKAWTYRGMHSFESFSPPNVLAGDNWICSSDQIAVGDVVLYLGDMVLALEDTPGTISPENINWKIIRNAGTKGGKLIAESIFTIDGGNYNQVTKRMTVFSFAYNFFKINDNVNIKVNGASYNHIHAYSIDYGTNEIVWKPGALDAGFDLEEGDVIEIEVFRN